MPALSLPPPPPLETAAVAVNEPAAVFAVNAGEVARPLAPVVAVAWVPPPAKLALAAAAGARAGAGGGERERDGGAGDRVAARVQDL